MLITKNSPNNNWRKYNGTNPATGNAGRMGKTQSVAVNKEVLQCRVNGKPLIAGSGITRANQRLGMLHDVFGQCSTYNFGNGLPFISADGDDRGDIVQGNGYLDLSCTDFYGLNLNNKVDDLQIDFSRQANFSEIGVDFADSKLSTQNNSSNQALTLNFYVEVFKTIIPNSDGSYNVAYV